MSNAPTPGGAASSAGARFLVFLDSFVDWVPFIVVASGANGDSTADQQLRAVFLGAILAGLVILYNFLRFAYRRKKRNELRDSAILLQKFHDDAHEYIPVGVFPKTLDVGQFLLFIAMYVVGRILADVVCPFGTSCSSAEGERELGDFFSLWTVFALNGGLFLIVAFTQFVLGKTFVLDYVLDQMPAIVFKELKKKQWFMRKINGIGLLWVNLLALMAAMSAVQPVLTTFVDRRFAKVASDDGGSLFTNWNNLFFNYLLGWGQFFPLVYGFYCNNADKRAETRSRRRVKEVMERGVSCAKYPLVDEVVVRRTMKNQLEDKNSTGKRTRIRSLNLQEDPLLARAAGIVHDAFASVDGLQKLDGVVDARDPDDCKRFLRVTLQAASYFRLVLGAFEVEEQEDVERAQHEQQDHLRAVMCCFPVYSDSQEEVDVFNDHVAWEEHGYEMMKTDVGESKSLRLPSDFLHELGELKRRHLVTRRFFPYLGGGGFLGMRGGGEEVFSVVVSKRPYIYIHLFAADPENGRGLGFGRSLLQHVIALSREKQMPLVLETTTKYNVKQYGKYGFQVVDSVAGKEDWVLLIREPDGDGR
eukprot:g4571.t1